MKLYPITLCDDHSVITEEGEYLGTWDTDESDAIFHFFPDGSTVPLLEDPFRWKLCKLIEAWHTKIPFVETPL